MRYSKTEKARQHLKASRKDGGRLLGQVIINIGRIKITSIESGGSLNIGEHIISCPTSEMSVEAGAGSLLKGDGHTISINKPTSVKPKGKEPASHKKTGGERVCL